VGTVTLADPDAGKHADAPARHVVLGFLRAPIYGVSRSWFRSLARVAVATGNPV